MNAITEYKIVHAENTDYLEYQVNQLIKEGWRPLGGLQTNVWVDKETVVGACYQAMVR